MIYDSDAAGQNAMKRNFTALRGLEVKLPELPDGEDPDSFVKQFGKESFDDIKHMNSQDFVDFLLAKAATEGRLRAYIIGSRINELIEAIAHIPDTIQRQVYIQHLHQKTQQYRKGTDHELFQELDRALRERAVQKSEHNSAKEISKPEISTSKINQPLIALNQRVSVLIKAGHWPRVWSMVIHYTNENAGRHAELDSMRYGVDEYRTGPIKSVPKPHYEKELIHND